MYSNFVIGHGANSSAAIHITNLDQISFQLSTTFQLGGYYAPDAPSAGRAGLAALSWGPDLSAGYQLSYQVYGPGTGNNFPNGTLTLYRPGTFISTILATTYGTGPLPIGFGATYTMILSGFYSASGLMLTGTLSNGDRTLTISAVDPSPLAGEYFGYYDAITGSAYDSSQMAVSYDNLSISSLRTARRCTPACSFRGVALFHIAANESTDVSDGFGEVPAGLSLDQDKMCLTERMRQSQTESVTVRRNCFSRGDSPNE